MKNLLSNIKMVKKSTTVLMLGLIFALLMNSISFIYRVYAEKIVSIESILLAQILSFILFSIVVYIPLKIVLKNLLLLENDISDNKNDVFKKYLKVNKDGAYQVKSLKGTLTTFTVITILFSLINFIGLINVILSMFTTTVNLNLEFVFNIIYVVLIIFVSIHSYKAYSKVSLIHLFFTTKEGKEFVANEKK